MTTRLASLALASLLVIGASLLGHAEETAKPAEAAPAAAKPDAPADVARPSIAPRTAEPAAPAATFEPAQRSRRRIARDHHRRYAYWEPFPIYLPHLHRHRIHWNRVPWNRIPWFYY